MFRFLMFKLKRTKILYSLTLIILAGLFFGMLGLEYSDELERNAILDQPKEQPNGTISLAINVQERVLAVYTDGNFYKKYRIGVGKSDTPTPIGEWNVVWKDYGWGSGFGTRWMGLNVPWGIYGIHGTNKPWSIGKFASHGCIRMRNKDVEELFEWVPIGTLVRIEGRKAKVQRVLKLHTAGPDVVQLQLKLKELGVYQSRADGLFGTVTEDAVRQYQQSKGLEPDGKITVEMAKELGI